MLILGIDTSFDDTSVAVVEDGVKILSNEIVSQNNIHEKTGGVVPEIAARTHTERIIETLKLALRNAKKRLTRDIDAIAITGGPGLAGSLLVGTGTGSVLGMFADIPIYDIHHTWGHLYANFLERGIHTSNPFPILTLTVAGGHSDLVLMKDWFDFEIIGSTLDDAAGECFDKSARLIGIADWLGGPELSKFAQKGNPREEFQFPRVLLDDANKKENLDTSFSGLKTAVRLKVEKLGELSDQDKYDLAYELQEAITDILSEKLKWAFMKYKPKTIFVTGGVSANDRLEELVTGKLNNPNIYFPVSKKLSTDNAAMIACSCYFLKNYISPVEYVLAEPNKKLTQIK